MCFLPRNCQQSSLCPLGNLAQGDLTKNEQCVWVDGALGLTLPCDYKELTFSLDVSSLINESSRTLPPRIKQKTLLVVNLNSYSLLSRHLSSTSAPSPSFPYSSLFFKSSWPVSGAPGVISLSFLQCHSPQYSSVHSCCSPAV